MSDVLLITTCDLAGGRMDEVRRLLDGVARDAAGGLRIVHHLLFQRCPDEASLPPLPDCVVADRVPGRMSLSAARNRLLRRAAAAGQVAPARLVAFPDDDAWHPEGLLRGVLAALDADPACGIATCGYRSTPLPFAQAPAPARIAAGRFVRTVSSNTLMLRGQIAARIGLFDEQLGVGAAINGGEDLDYALRAFAACGGNALAWDADLVGHRDRAPWVRSRYFAGSLVALSRAAGTAPGVRTQLWRKLAVGLALSLRLELKPAALGSALRLAWRQRGWRPGPGDPLLP